MLGLEFSFRFLKAVKAGDTIIIDWEVISAEPKANVGGEIVTVEGTVINQQGQTVLTGAGKVLIVEKL
jgi:acyl dehydratase